MRVTGDMELAAAARLVSGPEAGRPGSGKRLVTAAALHGIDLSLMWATVKPDERGRAGGPRQVCLLVPASGRTAMLLLSGPEAPGRPVTPEARAERVALVRCVRDFVARGAPGSRAAAEVRLLQALPEPAEEWAVAALLEAGFRRIGELAYLRAPLGAAARALGAPEGQDLAALRWPEGVVVRAVRAVRRGDPDRALLVRALERSYEDTLDCPELCGLREVEDVIESHRATGRWEASHWWLVFEGEEPHGCVLLNRCPEQRTVELVYLGLSRRLRGRGLGGMLLGRALAGLARGPEPWVTCAVDLRNVPARRLYERAGFVSVGTRVALVDPVVSRA